MSSSSSLFSDSLPNSALVATTAVASVAFLALARISLWPSRPRILHNPLKTGAGDVSSVYQPDAFPGARDVDTPYGTIRVYEFGPETGDKVLFVHGISTPCITLGRLAHAVAQRGYRVMLFDLFGRGFSDNPSDLPHDVRLYTSQMLLALASSPLSWTGTDAFRLVGYSLGGGIVVHFANAFPHLVSDLVLLAPAGLIRAASFGWVSQFLFKSGLVPERLLAVATRRRLQTPLARNKAPNVPPLKEDYIEIAAAEVADPGVGEEITPLEEQVSEYVRWMVVHHSGFVPAFMSSIRHAPLTEQHESWRHLMNRKPGTTAILLAEHDEIIDADEYAQEALPLVGGDQHVRWRVLPGGHDFVMTHVEDIMKQLDNMWGTSSLI